jgi:CDP-glucose 4,6-dehydratase
MKNLDTYKNLKVIITGSTGFKGSWLCFWLNLLGAKVIGISLKPEVGSILYKKFNLKNKITQYLVDIRNYKKLNAIIKREKPDIIFHLAAQSVVYDSYLFPLETLSTNILGSSNILETVRENKIKNLVYITSDKCYLNDGRKYSYSENSILGGEDLYSSSKASAELIFESYLKSFFNKNKKLKFASARAGNVIGGGDLKKDRIIPDVMRSISKNRPLIIRNPNATRPWQHVLEPLSGYLTLGDKLINNKISTAKIKPNWNFGPEKINNITVIEIVKKILQYWGSKKEINIINNKKFKEAKLLMIDNNKAKKELNWYPKLSSDETIKLTVDWYKKLFEGSSLEDLTIDQINFYSNKKIKYEK